MKLKVSIFLSAIILLFSCRADEEDTQVIDQVINLYLKNSSGQDLLNSNITGSYSSTTLFDLLGETELESISGYSLLKDEDTVVYLDYPAGAIRLLKDSVSPEQKTYYSKFVIQLYKEENSVTDNDTIEIEYNWTPSLFQISKLWYNEELKFTKVPGQRNVVTIVK